MPVHLDPTRRHEAVILFDATDSNPNGDPDAANHPRIDDETGHGLVTDVAIKRKIRDTVPVIRPDDPRYGIFVEAGAALQTRAVEGWDGRDERDALAWLCNRYYDIRMFGAVLTRGRGTTTGSVRGPVQLTFARSIDPVLPSDHTITRVTQTRQEDLDKGQTTEIGSKWTVPYGLYRAHLYYSPGLAARTSVTSDDMALLWEAITTMWEHTRSAVRSGVDLAGLWIISHPTATGVAPARRLLRRIQITGPTDRAPRSADDYQRTVDRRNLPDGVEITTLYDIWEDS
jgi:CRISPR-associated protein Csd2